MQRAHHYILDRSQSDAICVDYKRRNCNKLYRGRESMLNYETLFIHGMVQLTPNQEKVAKYILENTADDTYTSTNQMVGVVNLL